MDIFIILDKTKFVIAKLESIKPLLWPVGLFRKIIVHILLLYLRKALLNCGKEMR